MEHNGISKFNCFECGEHQLVVTHLWNVEAGTNSESWREWGPLKDDHHWEFQYKEKVEPNEDADEKGEVQAGTLGEFREDDSDSEPEDYEIIEPKTSRDSDE